MSPSRIKKIGKYDVLDVIGRGGMGVVFKATDPLLGRLVAIKMLTGGFVEDSDLLKRFYREAQGTASLHHPNIVTVYDMGDQDGNPYLVMEFLEGESLDAIIQSRRELSLLDRTNYVVQVCHGLEYAHQRSIIHRDIKPANIMVLPDGSVKIVDFGIARMGNDRVTRPGQVMGSIHYMSPEQIEEQALDARCDIFATGVVLYQLLAYALPFKGEDIPSTLLKIIREPAPPLSDYLPDCPADFEAVVERALAKNKEERYQSADEFAFYLLQAQAQLKRTLVTGILERVEPVIAAGELTTAKELLLQALKIDPQDPRANERMRDVLQSIQRRRRKEQAEQLRTQAEQEVAKNEFDQALRYLDQAISLDQTNHELQAFQNIVRSAQARANELRDAMRGAGSARRKGDLQLALRLLERALELRADHTPALTMRSEILREIAERERQERLKSLVEGAFGQISSRNFDEALETIKEIEELEPRIPQLQYLRELATQGKEQERRREEIAKFTRDIEQSLAAEDLDDAQKQSEESLRRYPDEPSLVKLKEVVRQRLTQAEKRRWVDEQIARARQALDNGQAEGALATLESAAQQYPTELALQSLLESVRQAVTSERLKKRKADISQRATDALQRNAFVEAIRILEAGKSELKTNDFDHLLETAQTSLNAEVRQRKVDAATAQAQTLIQKHDFERAIAYLENAISEFPDEQLGLLLTDAHRRAEDQSRHLEDVIRAAQRLVDEENPDEAILLLQQEAAFFDKFPDLKRKYDLAQQRRKLLAELEAEKHKVLVALSRDDFQGAETALQKCRERFGPRADFDALARQIDTQRAARHNATISKTLEGAAKLLECHSYSAALQLLERAADSVPFLVPERRQEYDNAVAAAKDGLESLHREAEARAQQERERREAEKRARQEAEATARRQAEERARAEERERARIAEEARAKREAEESERRRIEAEKQEDERRKAVLRAAKENALRQAEKLAREREAVERRKREAEDEERRTDDREQVGRSSRPGDESTAQIEPTQWQAIRRRPAREPGGAPLLKRDTYDTSVSELTPPEGLALPRTSEGVGRASSSARAQGPQVSGGTGKIELPGTDVPPAAEISIPSHRPLRYRAFLVVPVALIACGLGLWLWMRTSPATVTVQFATSPAGGQIRVGDQTCAAPCSLSLPAGDYSAEARHDAYATKSQPVSVRAGHSPQTVSITMDPLPAPATSAATTAPADANSPTAPPANSTGTLIVRSNVDGARVVVDNQRYGSIAEGILRIPLPAKAYTVEIKKDGFTAPEPHRVTIHNGRDTQISFNLKPTPAPAPSTPPESANEKKPAAAEATGASANLTPPSQPVTTAPATPVPPQPSVDEAAQLWARINNSRDRGVFEDFRKRFPSSRYAEQAAAKIGQIDWETARDKNTPDALQSYLGKYPTGPFSDNARRQLQKLQADLQHNSDRQAIISVLKRFEASYNGRNADQLAAIWPSLPKKEVNKYRESFKAAQSVHMQLDYSEPQIDGDVATVKCRRSLQFVFKQDVQPTRQDQVTIELRKNGGNWVIESAR